MKSFKFFMLTAALFAWGIVTVATYAWVWNSQPTATIAVVAGSLFAANGYAIFRKAKALSETIKENGGVK